MAKIGSGADSLASRFGSAKSAAAKFGAVLAGAFAINKAFGFAKSLVTMNAEMRQTKIGMAALLSTIGQNKRGETQLDRFRREMVNVGPIMDQLREMASHGIGTTADYRAAWQTLIMPLSRAGAGMKQVLNVSRLLIPVSKMLGIDSRIAAMQLQRMTMGQVRSFDRLPKMLGLSVQHVKALAKSNPAKLITEMEAALEKIGGPASILLGGEFGAQMDTFRDLWKGIKRKIGESLTDEVTKAIGGVNDMWVANKPAIDAWAANVGKQLGEAFNTAFGFAKDAAGFLEKHWDTIYTVGKELLRIWLAIKAAQVVGAAWQMGASAIGFLRGGAAGIGGVGMLGARMGGSVVPMAVSSQMMLPAGAGSFMMAPTMMNRAAEGVRMGVGRQLATMFNPARVGAMALGNALMVATSLVAGWELGKFADNLFGLSDKFATVMEWMTGEVVDSVNQARRAAKRQEDILHDRPVARMMQEFSLGGALQGEVAKRYAGAAEEIGAKGFGGLVPADMDVVRGAAIRAMKVAAGGRGELAKVVDPKDVRRMELLGGALSAIAAEPQKYMIPKSVLDAAQKTMGEVWPAASDKGAVQNVNMDLRGSRFEVKVDARDRDPDDIATVFWDGVYRASEFKVRSSVSPAGSI